MIGTPADAYTITPTDLAAVLDYIRVKVLAGTVEVLTLSDWWAKTFGRLTQRPRSSL
jgi:hypothetical protein